MHADIGIVLSTQRWVARRTHAKDWGRALRIYLNLTESQRRRLLGDPGNFPPDGTPGIQESGQALGRVRSNEF
jgi:hypothetical protein